MTKFQDWKEHAGAAREKWAVKYWSELETHIRDQFTEGEIFDETFVAVLKVCLPGGYSDTESFTHHTSIRQDELSAWIRGTDLPRSDVRSAYIHICLAAAGRKCLADRVVKLLTSRDPLPDVLFGSSIEDSMSEETSDIDSAPVRLVSVPQDSQLLEVFATKISDLGLGFRSEKCLRNECIDFVGQLVNYSESEILRIPNFGRKSLSELKESLSSMGVRLGMSVDHYPELDAFLKEHPPHKSPEQR